VPTKRCQKKYVHSLFVFIVFGVCIAGIYSNTLKAPFYFDDHKNIVENPNIRITGFNFRSIWDVAFARDSFEPTRIIPNISFALNYYVYQYAPWGYHFVNTAIHILTGIVLYFFLSLTLRLNSKREPSQQGLHKGESLV